MTNTYCRQEQPSLLRHAQYITRRCAVDAKSFWYDLMPKTNQKRAMKIKVKQNKALSLSKNFTNILD